MLKELKEEQELVAGDSSGDRGLTPDPNSKEQTDNGPTMRRLSEARTPRNSDSLRHHTTKCPNKTWSIEAVSGQITGILLLRPGHARRTSGAQAPRTHIWLQTGCRTGQVCGVGMPPIHSTDESAWAQDEGILPTGHHPEGAGSQSDLRCSRSHSRSAAQQKSKASAGSVPGADHEQIHS